MGVSSKKVSKEFQGTFKSVLGKLKGYFKKVLRAFQEILKSVSREFSDFQGYLKKGNLGKFQMYFRVFQKSFNKVWRVLHRRLGIILLPIGYWYFPFVFLLWCLPLHQKHDWNGRPRSKNSLPYADKAKQKFLRNQEFPSKIYSFSDLSIAILITKRLGL